MPPSFFARIAAAVALAAALASPCARAENYSDIWWNPGESGWGLTIADHQSQLFAVWFTYRQDGKPTWYVIPGGTFSSDRLHFQGDIYATTGPSYASAPFDSSRVTTAKVGTAAIDFMPAGAATFTYNVNGVNQTKQIQRQPFGSAPPSWGSDVTDIWWNPQESGWGLTLAQHGNNVFGVWFTYDADGQPLWVVMPGVTFNGVSAFTGNLYTTTGPYFASEPFDSSKVVATQEGSATVTLTQGGSNPQQCAGSQAGTFQPTFRGTSRQVAACHQPFGDAPTANVDIPAPMALPPGTPQEQAAAFADALERATDTRGRLAAWLGVYKALSIPVIDPNGISLTGTADDPAGPPSWVVWYGAGMDRPGGGMTLEEAANVLTMQGDGTFPAGSAAALLSDLRAAVGDTDARIQLFGAFVRERIRRGWSKQDIMASTSPADIVVDQTTVQLLQWVLVRETLAGIARTVPPPKSSFTAGPKATPNCDTLFGSDTTTKVVGWLSEKFYQGIEVPFTGKRITPNMVDLTLNQLGVSTESLETLNQRYLKSANFIGTLVSFYMQIGALRIEARQDGPLVRSKTTADGGYQDIQFHLYNDVNAKPDGKDLAACLASWALKNLGVTFEFPSEGGIPGAEITFDAGYNIPEKVYFDTAMPHYRINTDTTGWATQHFRGRGQLHNLPSNAKEYSDSFSVYASGQPTATDAGSIASTFIDSFKFAYKPDLSSIVSPVLDIMKTLHYDLGEVGFALIDWAAGLEVDQTDANGNHVWGTICNGLENPFTLNLNSAGFISGTMSFTPTGPGFGTFHLSGQLDGVPVTYQGDGTYSIIGEDFGNQRIQVTMPAQNATYPGPTGPITIQVPGFTGTYDTYPSDKCN